MKKNAAWSALKWVRSLVLVATAFAGSAHAASYNAVWDPDFGSPFVNLGWRGSATFVVPNECVLPGTGVVTGTYSYGQSYTPPCGGQAMVTDAQVQLYDNRVHGEAPTLRTLSFDDAKIAALEFTEGRLTNILALLNFVRPFTRADHFDIDDPFSGANAWTRFGLFFELPTSGGSFAALSLSDTYLNNPGGPGLGYLCGGKYCRAGRNDFVNSPPLDFRITPVPEPASLALVAVALVGAVSARRRASRRTAIKE